MYGVHTRSLVASTGFSCCRRVESFFAKHRGYHTHWEKGNLFTTLDTSLIRNIFTTVFVVLNISIVPGAGGFFLKSLNLHRLSPKSGTKRKRVPITRLTSWISLCGTLRYVWGTHALPGGFYGLLMLSTGVLGLAHQHFVNSFIVSLNMQSDCPFQYGVLTTRSNNADLAIVPSSTLSAASTVYNAQYHVYFKGGFWGIYEKFNYNFTTFSPSPRDVIGWWNCSYQPDTTITWTDWQTESSVESFLQQQGFLFTDAFQFTAEIDTHAVQGFLKWSADQPDGSDIQWAVRASVSTGLSGSGGPVDSTGIVVNLECQLVPASDRTLPLMPSQRSLTDWAEKTYGFLQSAEPQQYGFYIEWILNAMVMVTGTGNNNQPAPSDWPAGVSTTYGCIVHYTKIKPEIWIMLGAILLIFVPLFLTGMFLSVFRLSQSWNVDHAHLATAAPSSVDEWQLAMIIEVTGDETIKATDMRDYSYGWDVDKKKCVIAKKGMAGNMDVENSPSSSTSMSSANEVSIVKGVLQQAAVPRTPRTPASRA